MVYTAATTVHCKCEICMEARVMSKECGSQVF